MTTSTIPSLQLSRPLLWVCRILCAIALVISGYLAWTAFNASEVAGCGGGEILDCSHVLNSHYAKIFGLPVSVPAFGMYASLLALLAFFGPNTPEKLLRVGWGILTVGALSAGLAALWFISIQVFALEHLCTYCLGAHACGLTLSGIVIWKRPFGWMRLGQLGGVSAAGIALLITGQLTAEAPQTFVVERYDEPSGSDPVQVASLEGAEEFGAPMTFDAPVEFAPPGGEDNLFAPPSAEPDAAVADNLFAPPVDAVEVPAAASDAVQTEVSTETDGSHDATTSLPAETPDVGATEETSVQPTAAAAAYLFFAPSGGNSVVSRLLLAFSGPAAAHEPAAANPDENAQTQSAKKPVIVAAPVKKERLVTVAGRRFSLNTRHWPLLGDPDAKYVFVEMFDYTCPHCRNTHHAIEGAFTKFGDQLAVIALPVPLERSCNPSAKGNGHVGACDQATLAVAVWRCDRNKFREFHHWMFAAQRSTSQAQAKAEQLVGKDRLKKELALGHARQYVSKHVELYKRVGSGAVPKLMFPKSTMTGQVSSAATLVSTIQRELAAK